VKRAAHFRLHLVIDRFPVWLRRQATILGILAVIGFGWILIEQGWKLVELGQFQQTPVMGLSKQYVYASVPVGGALVILFSLPHLWRALRGPAAASSGH
jgi:TRAP-type C4-dicarboxylate transport system permease small subunit